VRDPIQEPASRPVDGKSQPKYRLKIPVLVLLLAVLLSGSPQITSGDLPSIKEGVCNFYEEAGPTRLAAVLRIGRVYEGFQRKGFFRIGALPMGVVEKVELQLFNPAFVERALRHCTHLHSGKGFEVWGLQVTAIGSTTNQICSRFARPAGTNIWQLYGGVTFTQDTHVARYDRAQLVLGGVAGATFVAGNNGACTNSLFSSLR